MAESSPSTRTEWQEAVARLNEETSASASRAFERGESAGAREFLWQPLVAAARALFTEPSRGRCGRLVFEGYKSLVHAAKLWDAERVWQAEHVEVSRRGRRELVARREWRETVESLLERAADAEPIAGGRGGTSRFATPLGPVVVRSFRRGGWMRLAGSVYFGRRARPIREFRTLLRARRRGLPVPEPIAAVVDRHAVFFYRGALVMREIEAGLPLFTRLSSPPEPPPGLAGVLGRAIRSLHDQGLAHRDLNLTNVLVLEPGSRFAFVDLDRARLHSGPLGGEARRRTLRRIRRSARRLDPGGVIVKQAFLTALEQAYWGVEGTSR